ncbi:MAG: ASCH domain-containing protein [Streptosporangiaceae bacterium]
MEFSRELREAVVAGEITLTFRLWRQPKVRAGARYPVGPALIEVESIELVPFSSVTRDDLDRAGEKDLESLRRRTAHAGPVHDETLVYRIEFHVV